MYPLLTKNIALPSYENKTQGLPCSHHINHCKIRKKTVHVMNFIPISQPEQGMKPDCLLHPMMMMMMTHRTDLNEGIVINVSRAEVSFPAVSLGITQGERRSAFFGCVSGLWWAQASLGRAMWHASSAAGHRSLLTSGLLLTMTKMPLWQSFPEESIHHFGNWFGSVMWF